MENIKWNELRDRAYQNAVNHGFHEKPLEIEHYLMLVITELSEAVNADRKGLRANIDDYIKGLKQSDIVANTYRDDTDIYRETRPDKVFEKYIKDTVEDELADAAIRLLDFAGAFNYNIDIGLFQEESYAELSEELEKFSFTKNIYTVIISFKDVRTNISSILYYLFAIDWHYKIDLLWHIEQKMKYNENRPYKHGKKY